MAAKNEKISLHAIKFDNLRKASPFCELEPPEKRDALGVMRKDEPEQGGEP